MQGTTEFHHEITDPLLPQADPVLHDATALDTAVDMLDAQPTAAISGVLLSAVISIRYILGFRKDNPNVFNMLVQSLPVASGIKCICC